MFHYTKYLLKEFSDKNEREEEITIVNKDGF